MRTHLNGILTLILAFVVHLSFAQEKTVTGNVTDQTGTPLPGVNVLVVGTATGTQTDFDGNYSIRAEVGQVLQFSYIGQKTANRTIGASDVINVQMEEDAQALEEVVVTALGIQREARTLGYGTDIVEGEDLVKARETNIVNSLQGKVTGVQITNTGGNLGGSSKIIIRGVSSLSGRNNPLWVVDGVLINDAQTPGNGSRITGTRDFANGASVINPDDVESINVLKGAAATALYGSRAAAGAIIVTTKRGKAGEGGGARVELNSSTRFESLFRIPDYQQEYAMGTQGQYDAGSVGFDWGPRIVGQTVDNLPITGESGPLQAVKDNGIRDFFRTGITRINNFSVSDANEKFDYRISLTSTNQEGILPGASLDRITIGLNAGVRHNDKLESRFGIQYTTTQSRGTGASGANDPNIISFASFSSNLDQNLFKPWIDESGNQINLITNNQGNVSNNPFWIRNENANDRDDDRIFGNFQLTFKPFDGFALTARVGADLQDDRRLIENSKGTVGRLFGDFISDNIRRNEITSDIIASYNTNITDDISVNVLGGMQYNARIFERQQITGVNLLIPELFSPANAEQAIPVRDFTEARLFGIYGSAEFGYKNWATLTLTARNDFSSTLPTDNNSYFYPSASMAFVFSDAFNIKSDFLSFGKIRASWAKVGNDTDAYLLNFNFNPITVATGQYSLNNNFPFNGALAYSASATIPAADLRPEEQTSYEFGLDLKLFNGRLGLDMAYFKNQNDDQILNIPIPETTGFAFRTTNVGRVDQEGFEISLEATPLIIGDFTWNTGINFSRVESEVVSLTEGLDRVVIASGFNSVQVVAEPGKEFQLYAFPHLRDEETGRPIIDPNTGRRQAGQATTLGSVLPDWTGGWVNSFSYKGFNLSTTIDVRWGGVMKSSTVEALQTGGLVKETLLNREGTFIDTQGIILTDNGDGTFTRRDNDVPLLSAQDFWTSLNDNSVAEPYIYDASFIKLREVGLSYTFPSRLLGDSFIKGLTFGVEGRNLLLLYSEVPHIDPEATLFGSGADGFGIERASIPSTRSIGFNVKLTF
ncbi:SusC/RagA family TonB-linked outer membrane protein [Lentiprolixibacter aurantiacus]|uniref:SusC/RagA family TonB-linked outer membrane protein n=1 Tax=Lentiprolixibacter aurantiacus TaxID=2993939 RepID=A0AAE3SPX9_9FLAO|nr:SusC/RagA family TonB-linked outer membrane protein [Lentiprolixibacter aurantiacus]MCX2720691.1 SusC/RagA family TonB-linked outer membrane protein [Lentiprolixibacter aurantiacus]